MKAFTRITVKEAFNLWQELYDAGEAPNEPYLRTLYLYLENLEGLIGINHRGSAKDKKKGTWIVYKERFISFITGQVTDYSLWNPVLSLAEGLRYLHANGISKSYTLREFRKDAAQLGFIKKVENSKGIKTPRITRARLNKFIGIWNGCR